MARLLEPLFSETARGRLIAGLILQTRGHSSTIARTPQQPQSFSRKQIRQRSLMTALAQTWATDPNQYSAWWATQPNPRHLDPYHLYVATNQARRNDNKTLILNPTGVPPGGTPLLYGPTWIAGSRFISCNQQGYGTPKPAFHVLTLLHTGDVWTVQLGRANYFTQTSTKPKTHVVDHLEPGYWVAYSQFIDITGIISLPKYSGALTVLP